MENTHTWKIITLKKETEQEKISSILWKHRLCSWIERINIIKMSILHKAICRFNTIPTNVPMAYFTELEEVFQKFIWNYKRPQIATVTLRKKNKVTGVMLPDIRL